MSNNSNRKPRRRKSTKPKKPYADFPLYPHPLGYWSKKINTKILHFGRWGRVVNGRLEQLPYEEGWSAALRAYKARVDDAKLGRVTETVVSETPSKSNAELTVRELCNKFLTGKFKKTQRKNRPLSPRTFIEYRQVAEELSAVFGKNRLVKNLSPSDFGELYDKIDQRVGVIRLGNEVNRVKTIFNWGRENLDGFPAVKFGSEFVKPQSDEQSETKGKKLFSAEEISWLLAGKPGKSGKQLPGATPQLRAMILLGINCGYGNTDVACVQVDNLNLETGWANFPRPKTRTNRRCPLWPETVSALEQALKSRPKPKLPTDANCVFLTPEGNRWVRVALVGKEDNAKLSKTDAVTKAFGSLLRSLSINGRNGLGFYSLRHTFTSVGLQAKDRDCVKSLMGHVIRDTLSIYDETGPSDERRRVVVNHIRAWLFGEGGTK